jgi:hypothetical protein
LGITSGAERGTAGANIVDTILKVTIWAGWETGLIEKVVSGVALGTLSVISGAIFAGKCTE